MNDNDARYFARRAEQEVELAQHAASPAAVAAHYRLSTAYLDRLHRAGDQGGQDPAT